MRYRRVKEPGATYFFTLVTFKRQSLFSDPLARHCLHHAMQTVRQQRPFTIEGICLLPDHLHVIWRYFLTIVQSDTGFDQ